MGRPFGVAADLSAIHEGQKITLTGGNESSPATIMFVSPLLDKETRAARVIASVDNAARKWRPGTFVTAEIPTDEAPAAIVVAKTALQTVKGDPVVFVRTEEGFEARKVSCRAARRRLSR